MKTAIKKLPFTLLTGATLLVLGATSPAQAQADTLTATGNVATSTCVLTFVPNAASTTGQATFFMPNLTSADWGTAAGPLTSVGTVDIVIKALATGGAACTASQKSATATPTTLTTFNTIFTGTPDNTAKTKIANSFQTVAGGTVQTTAATGLTFDLVSKPASGAGTSVDITKSTAADQHGLPAAAFSTGQTFTVRWYRTTAVAPTTGTVTANYTVSSFYQ